jgi:hypothetical protein
MQFLNVSDEHEGATIPRGLLMMGQNPSMDFLCDCAEAPLVAPALVAGVRTGITLAASARNVRRLAKTYWA